MNSSEEMQAEVRGWITEYIYRPLSSEEKDSEYKRALDLQLSKPKLEEGFEAIHYVKRSYVAIMDLLGSVARWHPANPNRPHIVTRLNDTYQSTVAVERATAFDLPRHFLDALKKDQLIALVGNRGAGKTAFVNHWVNNNTKTILEKELKLSWFRIDAHKVYSLWFDDNANGKQLTLVEYFKVHAAYVMLVYGGKVPKLLRDNHTLSDQFVSLIKWFDKNKYDSLFTPSVKELAKWLEAKFGEKVGDYSEFMIREIVVNSGLKSVFIDLYDFLQAELTSRGVGLLCILDGLDNISWSRANTQYHRMCLQVGELRDFVLNHVGKNPNATARLVLAVRPETLPDIPFIDYYYHEQGFKVGSFKCLRVEPPRFQSVLNRKCSALQYSRSFELERNSCSKILRSEGDEPSQYMTFQISRITEYSDDFVKTLETSILSAMRASTKIRKLSKIENDTHYFKKWAEPNLNLVEILFNKNCRAFVDGFLQILGVLKAAEELSIKGATNKHRLLQYLLLNGRLYVDSRQYETQSDFRKKISRGEYFPNLLWFNTQISKTEHSVWHGLVSIRILQFCLLREFIAEEVVTFLHAVFGYSAECIEDRIESLVAFGLLDSEKSSQKINRFGTAEVRSRWAIQLTVTDRARLLLDIFFAYPDWMYFMALDTPIPSILSGSSNHMRPHVDPKSKAFLNNFFDAYCITLPTIIRTIKHYEMIETERMKNFSNSTEPKDAQVIFGVKSTFIDANTLLRGFRLPKNWENSFNQAVENGFAARQNDDPQGARILYNDMKGAFGA